MYSSVREYFVRLHIGCMWWSLAVLGVWLALAALVEWHLLAPRLAEVSIDPLVVGLLPGSWVLLVLLWWRWRYRQKALPAHTMAYRLAIYRQWIATACGLIFLFCLLHGLLYWLTLRDELLWPLLWLAVWLGLGWPSAARAVVFLRLKGEEKKIILHR